MRYDGDTDVSYKKKKFTKPVRVYDLNFNFISDFNSAVEASKFTNGSRPDICECCKGRKDSVNGYKFKYKEQCQD